MCPGARYLEVLFSRDDIEPSGSVGPPVRSLYTPPPGSRSRLLSAFRMQNCRVLAAR
jgi:hypothetical protein